MLDQHGRLVGRALHYFIHQVYSIFFKKTLQEQIKNAILVDNVSREQTRNGIYIYIITNNFYKNIVQDNIVFLFKLNEFELEYDNPNDRHVPIVATIGVLTAYILAGAVIFSITEGWNVLDGAYFCFITFTTIG